MSTIAFIGLGNMGGGMAANLVKGGHIVHAFDLAESALAKAAEAGCKPFTTVKEAVAGVDAVVSMLPNGKIVQAVYENDVIGHAPAGALLLDCSTIDVATARVVAAAASAKGYPMVDAPVSGGIAAANGGTLTFMVGGPDDAFKAAEPILAKMGKAVIHAGASGAGQAAKICNNMILGATMIATCEAFVMAKKLGVEVRLNTEANAKFMRSVLHQYDVCVVAAGAGIDRSRVAHIEGAAVHEPWLLIDGLANGYPAPILDHAKERDESLARLKELKADA